MNNTTRHEYSSLIKEQRQLKKAESILKSMIENINHELNQLVVEELQINARDAQLSINTVTARIVKPDTPMEVATSSTKEINQQKLNLEVQHDRLLESLEETEDEL